MTVRTVRPGLAAVSLALAAAAACDSTKPSPPPVAVAGGAYTALAGEAIQFDGTASSDPNGSPLTFAWDFGNGDTGEGPTPTYTYNVAGAYDVNLVVTNGNGKKSAPSATTATIDPWVADTLVKDLFDRTTDPGWGLADMGGEWQRMDLEGGTWSVANGTGLITKSDHGMRIVAPSGGYGLDVEGVASFSIDRLPDAPSFYTVQVYARRDDTPGETRDNRYRFRVRAHQNGAMDIGLDKEVGRVTTFVTSENIPIPTVWAPATRYWIRWQTVGTSPSTALRMRVWQDGAEEPADWQLDVTHDEPALDIPGTTGFRVEGPNVGQTTWPVTFSFDDLVYRKVF